MCVQCTRDKVLEVPLLGFICSSQQLNEGILLLFCVRRTEDQKTPVAYLTLGRWFIARVTVWTNFWLQSPGSHRNILPPERKKVRDVGQGLPTSACCENLGLCCQATQRQRVMVLCPSLITHQRRLKEVPCLPTCLSTKGLARLRRKTKAVLWGHFQVACSLCIAKDTIVPTEFAFINLVAGYFEGKFVPSSLYLAGIR